MNEGSAPEGLGLGNSPSMQRFDEGFRRRALVYIEARRELVAARDNLEAARIRHEKAVHIEQVERERLRDIEDAALDRFIIESGLASTL